MEDKSQQEKRGIWDCPGELITSAEVAVSPFDGTVSTFAFSQSSYFRHCAGVKEGVREVEGRITSDLGKTGDTMVETRPEVGHSEENGVTMHTSSILPESHSNPVNGGWYQGLHNQLWSQGIKLLEQQRTNIVRRTSGNA